MIDIDAYVEREFDHYLRYQSHKMIDIDNHLVSWWGEDCEFPLLREVSRSVLPVFSSSANLERDFCFGGSIVTPYQSQMSEWLVALLLVLRVNFDNLPPMEEVEEFISHDNLEPSIPAHLKHLLFVK